MSGPVRSTRNTTRFIFVSDEAPRANSVRRPQEGPQRIGWRAIAANNRPMGRSLVTFTSLEECLAELQRLAEHVEQLRPSLTFSHSGSSWSWTVYLDDEPVATCARPSSRRIEAVRAVNQFIDIVRSEPDSPRRVRKLGIYAQPAQSSEPRAQV